MRARAWLWILAAAALVSLPVLSLGFFNDDLILRLALSGATERYRRGAIELYDFLRGGAENAALMEAGLLPWFTEPTLGVRFFRPLSSLLLALDVRLFGDAALPAHLHSLAWFFSCVALVWKIQRALLPERAALWGTFVFAIAGAHAESTSWIAARHVLVSGAFGLAAWYSEIAGQQNRRKGIAVAGAALLALALLASEAGLAVVPFVLAQAWFGDGTTRRRVLRVLPTLAIALVYLAGYTLAGYGARNVGIYVSPFDEPVRFFVAVFRNLPLLAGELFTCVPGILSYVDEATLSALWALGSLVTALVVGFGLKKSLALGDAGRNLAWISGATAASLVPFCGTIISGRVLLVPMVGSSALLGVLLSRIAPVASSSRAGAVGVGLLFCLHLGLSPVLRVALALNYRKLGTIQAELAERSKLECDARARLLVVNGSDPTLGMYGATAYYRSERVERLGFHVLSMAQNDLELERVGPNAFVLATVGPRRGHFIEEFYRSRRRALRPGDVVRLTALSATVLAAEQAGPTRVRFDFASDPNARENCLARWVGGADGRLESFSLPDSGRLRVRYEPGPSGM